MEIIRTKQRIDKTGEIFTPSVLVGELLDHLPKELFSNPTKTFCDPACGDGNFLAEIVIRKMSNGSSGTQALSTTFGVDLMSDNVDQTRQRLLDIAGNTPKNRKIVQNHIVHHDALSYDFLFGENSGVLTF